MKLGSSKAIKTGKWTANEMLIQEDINALSEFTYQNTTDLLALLAEQGKADGTTKDTVLAGLFLEWSTVLTCYLRTGVVVSYQGKYSTAGAWGFVSSSGEIFSVVVDEDTAVAFDVGDSQDRIDLLEIRPVLLDYELKTRQFKDPITGLVSSALVNTRREYGFEFQIKKGTPGGSPVAPSKTSGWIKLAEVTIPTYASSINQSNIKDVRFSASWTSEPQVTINRCSQAYLIASFDSPERWKKSADFVLDSGTDLCALLTLLHGPTLKYFLLSPGSYTSASTFAPTSDVTIQAFGRQTIVTSAYGTIFDFSSTSAAFYLKDILLVSTKTIEVADQFLVIGQTSIWTDVAHQGFFNVHIKLSDVGGAGYGFSACQNLNGCSVVSYNTGNSISFIKGFSDCVSLVNCIFNQTVDTTAGGFWAFANCNLASNCKVIFASGISAYANAFYGGSQFLNCSVYISTYSSTLTGFYNITNLSSCYVENCTTGYSNCVDLSSCKSSKCGTGFNSCISLSACRYLNDSFASSMAGFYSCQGLHACVTDGGSLGTTGFDLCFYLSNCRASAHITGYATCQHIVACNAATNITTGFSTCKQMQQNYSVNNPNNYTSCFADQSINAVANTSAGGYNR